MNTEVPSPGYGYTDVHLRAIKTAVSYDEMLALANDIVRLFPTPPPLLCASWPQPITSVSISACISKLSQVTLLFAARETQPNLLFSPAPFMEQAIAIRWRMRDPFGTEFAGQFYGPLFQSRYLSAAYFFPDWAGAPDGRIQYRWAEHAGKEIKVLKTNYQLLGSEESPFA